MNVSGLLQATPNPPSGTIVVDEIYKLDRKVFIIQNGNKYGLVNKKGKEILPPKYDSLLYTELQDQYIAYLLNPEGLKAAGIITEKDKKVIPIGYRNIKPVALTLYAVSNFKNSTALYNSDGKQKTGFDFDEITAFKGSLARYYKNGKAGVINFDGKILLPATYKDIIIRSDSTVDAVHLRNWKIMDGNNRQLNELYFDSIRPVGEDRWVTSIKFYNASGHATLMNALNDAHGKQLIGYRPMYIFDFEGELARIREQQRFGVINRDGAYILPADFDSVAITTDAIIAGTRIDRQWSWHLFDLQGRKKSRHTYQALVPQQHELIPAKLNGRWGYINQQGAEVLLCRYDTTYAFEGELARVRFNGNMGVINREGVWQLYPSAEHIAIVTPKRFVVRNQNNHQLLDEQGKVLYSSPHVLTPVEGGLLEVNLLKQYGLIDLNGKRIADTEYDWISELKEGEIYLARKGGRKGILSKDGKSFMAESSKTYQRLYELHEGYLAAEIDGQYGFVDTQGRLRISNRYDSVTYFSDGYAAIKLRGRWGYIDKIERLRIQPLYEEARPFEDGMAIIQKNGLLGLVNKKGEEVIRPDYEEMKALKSGRYLIVKSGKMGITDSHANYLLSAKYDDIRDLKNGYFLVSRSGKKGLVNYQGVSTIPMMYDMLVWDEINNLYLCSDKGEYIERITIK